MKDTIYRQAAIDFIDAGHLCNPNEPRWSDNEVVNFLKSRPSAQPKDYDYSDGYIDGYKQGQKDAQFPTGEWLRMSDFSEKDDDRYKCSRCGNVVHHESRVDLYTFNSWCGRCGSDNSKHTYRKENRGKADDSDS